MKNLTVLSSGRFFVFVALLLAVLPHFSFISGTHAPLNKQASATEVSKPVSFVEQKMQVFDSLDLDMAGLSREAFETAVKGMEKLLKEGLAKKDDIISIVDFSKPSTSKRLYVIDLVNYRLLFNTFVAHGMNSGKEMAESFSNKVSSNKSSLGFYVTGETYKGGHGYSLRLMGVEKGINDNAYARAIVMHSAKYVNERFAERLGYIGRSHGCPAVPVELNKPIINNIKDGSCLFIYYPSQQYFEKSGLLS